MHSLITTIKHWLVNICCCFVTWEPDRFVIKSSVWGVLYLRQKNKLGDSQLKDHLNVYENIFWWSWTWIILGLQGLTCFWSDVAIIGGARVWAFSLGKNLKWSRYWWNMHVIWRGCYGLNCFPSKFLCWSTNPTMCLNLGKRALAGN